MKILLPVSHWPIERPPKIFYSDNGREFVNQLIRAMFDKWGGGNVTFINGRPRHSQSQGLAALRVSADLLCIIKRPADNKLID